SDGFQLGSDNDINRSGRTYHWIAFKRNDYPVAVPSLAMRSGSYTGNGLSGRQITGVGFQPDVVMIKSEGAHTAVIRTSTMNNDLAKEMVGTNAFVNNRIIAMHADGFTLGADSQVNGSGVTYYWVAIRAAPGVMTLGTYTGNGVAGRAVTGVGFTPDLVIVLPGGAEQAVYRTSTMGGSNSANFETSTSTSWITGFTSDGFTVGSGSSVNANGQTYHYLAVRQASDQFVVGTYVGNGSVNRDVTGIGLSPEWVVIRQLGSQHPAHRPAAIESLSTSSLRFDASGLLATRIRGLLSDGFTVGNHGEVNSNGVTYHYFAFANRTAPTTIDFAESVWLGALTGGMIGDCMCRFNATYTWSNGNRTLTVTIGERTHGSTYPTLSAATWTFWPTTVTARLQSASGGHHICDSSSGGGNCLPVTAANSRP
ncbi:MAG: hypothetical protein NZ518_07855, partial [Dehalococcoidia bacterium]|nr:hypothetical protein [Dehalococcoidia bacterium]